MNVEDMRTFVEVADTGGVTSAARRLGTSKSMVSRQLRRLEAELGVQLLARTTRGASLTEAGATFRDHAARVCAEIDVARETILPGGELRGLLRIAAPLSFGPTHFAPVLVEMARRHPHLKIHIGFSDHAVDLAADGFDCAIRLGYLKDSGLTSRRVGRRRSCFSQPQGAFQGRQWHSSCGCCTCGAWGSDPTDRSNSRTS